MAARSLGLYDTAIGKKAVMALSGVILLGFVFTHMAGNLLIFKGEQAMNDYALGLRELLGGAGIWIARVVLLGAIGAHIWSAMALNKQNRNARPVPYKRTVSKTSSAASKTMMFGGITLLLYIGYHIAHLTFGVTTPNYNETNVYANVVSSFKVWWIVAIYLVAQVSLAFHLYHGAWSFMQSMGLSHPRYNDMRKRFAGGFAFITAVGFAIVPLAIITGQIGS